MQIHTKSATPHPPPLRTAALSKECPTGVIKLRHCAASAAALCTQRKGKKNPKSRREKEVFGVLAVPRSSCRVVFRTREEKRQQSCLFSSLGNVNDQTVTYWGYMTCVLNSNVLPWHCIWTVWCISVCKPYSLCLKFPEASAPQQLQLTRMFV